MNDRLISFFLNELKSGEKGEIYIKKSKEKNFEPGSGKIEKITKNSKTECAVRLLKDNKLSFGFLTDPDEIKIKDLLNRVREIIPYQKERKNFAFPEKREINKIDGIYDNSFEETSDEKYIDYILSKEREILDYDKRVKTTKGSQIQVYEEDVLIANSNGVNYNSRKTGYAAEVMIVAEENGITGDAWGFTHSYVFDELDGKIFVSTADKAIKSIGGIQPTTGKYPVILENKAMSLLLNVLFTSFNYENIYKNKSPLVGKLGDKIASEKISLKLNGLNTKGTGAFPFDDEGVVSKENNIIKNGILSDYVYDTEYANISGKEPSSTSVRESVSLPPAIRARNFYMKEGAENLNEILNSENKIIIVTELMGLHTLDPVTWKFSLGAKGFLYENGKFSSPVQQFTIAGDIFELFSSGVPLDDLQFTGSVGAPSLFVKDVNIAGK